MVLEPRNCDHEQAQAATFTLAARVLQWLTATLFLVLVPTGITLDYRAEYNVASETTR